MDALTFRLGLFPESLLGAGQKWPLPSVEEVLPEYTVKQLIEMRKEIN